MRSLQAGDRVEIGFPQRSDRLEGKVILASANGASIMLEFVGKISGHINMMPVLRGRDGQYRSIITDEMVTIEPIA